MQPTTWSDTCRDHIQNFTETRPRGDRRSWKRNLPERSYTTSRLSTHRMPHSPDAKLGRRVLPGRRLPLLDLGGDGTSPSPPATSPPPDNQPVRPPERGKVTGGQRRPDTRHKHRTGPEDPDRRAGRRHLAKIGAGPKTLTDVPEVVRHPAKIGDN
ncbi:hypothetical protein Bbelb_021400 [Branchiostoma belcheri]|nr:hypothetical protein Bbelb_021400 [Branchiostoma belcheri]